MANAAREIDFPFRIGADGGIAYLEDPIRIIMHRIEAIIRTIPGERVMVPNFGSSVPLFLFDNNDPISLTELSIHLRTEITRWEPVIVLNDVTAVSADPFSGVVDINIRFSVPPLDRSFFTVVQVGSAPEVLRG